MKQELKNDDTIFKLTKSISISGIEGVEKEFDTVRKVNLTKDKNCWKDSMIIAEMPFDKLEDTVGTKVHGLLGSLFLKRHKARIDYENNKLILQTRKDGRRK